MLKRFKNGADNGTSIIGIYAFILIIGIFLEFFAGGSSEVSPVFSQFVHYGIYLIIALLGIIFALNTYSINHLRQMLKKFQETGRVTPYLDLTDENLDLPTKFQETVAELETLGFEFFAVLDASENHDRSQTIWYWTDETQTVRAYLSLVPPLKQMVTAFITILEDEGTVETGYNVRMQMETNNLHVRNITTSLSVAYDFHLQQIVKYEEQHGQPIAISNSAELLEWSNHLKQKQYPAVYENRLENLSKYTMLIAFMIIGLILAVFISQWIDIAIAVGITGIIMGVALNFFNYADVKEAFGSVEGRKKQKN